MEAILREFPEEVARVLADVMESEDGELILRREGADLILTPEVELCFTYELRLNGVEGLPEEVADGWLMDCGSLTREGSGYRLTGWVQTPDWDNDRAYSLTFRTATAAVRSVCPESGPDSMRPWIQLGAWASGLHRKARVVPQLMNEREMALLPLMEEIFELFWLGGIQPPREDFHLLRSRLTPELNRELDRLVRSAGNWKRYRRAEERFRSKLERVENLPIWQAVRDAFAASQDTGPVHPVDPEIAAQAEAFFHDLGYSGSYPDFTKKGEIRGLRVARSFEMSYFVFRERNAVFYIHCQERWFNGELAGIEFLCGTELLRKGQSARGIDACRFHSNGRTFWRSVGWNAEEDLSRSLRMAVLKAELRPISRQDRDQHDLAAFGIVFLVTFLMGGAVFGLLLTLGLLVLSVLITAVLAGWAAVPEMMLAVPWGKLFLLGLAGFGGAMGIVEWFAFWND